MIRGKTKIVICDTVVPGPGELNYLEEKAARTLDMQMMTALDAKERTVSDWEKLFEAAGLTITKRSKPPGSSLSLIEVMLR